MSIGARYGSFLLLAGLASSALAQDRPSGTWQDPPARDAAVGQPSDADKTVQPSPAAEPRPKRQAVDRTRNAARPTARRERAERRSVIATAEPRSSRSVLMRERPSSARRFAAHRREEIAWREEPRMLVSVVRPRLSDVPRRHPLAGFRSEGWGPLLRESREARIAEARSRGFIVLRAQTWRGPDGRLSRRLTEDDPEDE